MKPFSLILIIPFLLITYQEIMYWLLYRKISREGILKTGKVIYIHKFRSAYIYKVKILEDKEPYSKHQLKKTFLSSLYLGLLKKEFSVFLVDNSNLCLLANPLFMLLDFILLILFGVGTFFLIYWSEVAG